MSSAENIEEHLVSVKTSGLQIYWLAVMGLNIRVAIRRGSDVRGKPLLLLNGIGASLEVLEGFIAAMPGCEVIIFDVPGAGKSEAPVLPWRLHTYARLTAKILDQLDYRPGVAPWPSNLPASIPNAAESWCFVPQVAVQRCFPGIHPSWQK